MSMHVFARRDAVSRSLPVDALSRPRDPGLAQEFHYWPLPNYVWPALERRYHSSFCSEPHLRIHGALTPDIEARVARDAGCISSLLLYERRSTVARVLNEVFVAEPQELADFADAVFGHYPALDAIVVRSAAVTGRVPGYTCLAVPFSEDFVLQLPTDVDQWMSSLSAQTREKLRYHMRRTRRKQPSFRFRTLNGAEISDAQLRSIIDFNRARMEKKGRRFGMSAAEEHGLVALMRERGWLTLIEIDGKARAGLLCTQAGDDVYMHVVAHDPALDDLRLGYLCCVLTIQDAIERSMQRFHFLWGHYDYKTRLGGQRVELRQLLLLRTPLAALWHPRLLLMQLRAALLGMVRARLRTWREGRARRGRRGTDTESRCSSTPDR